MKHGTKKKLSRDIRLDTTHSLFAIHMRTDYGKTYRWTEIVELEPSEVISVVKEAEEWLNEVGRDGSIPPVKSKPVDEVRKREE